MFQQPIEVEKGEEFTLKLSCVNPLPVPLTGVYWNVNVDKMKIIKDVDTERYFLPVAFNSYKILDILLVRFTCKLLKGNSNWMYNNAMTPLCIQNGVILNFVYFKGSPLI